MWVTPTGPRYLPANQSLTKIWREWAIVAHSPSARAVVPPPHLVSKYVDFSTKNQPLTFVGKTALDMAYVSAKTNKIDSAFFYTVSSNFYRRKIIEKS
ncbi:hypothetical protein E1953_13595 [Acinetobacter baumannii]|nr:hypothetical protein E1953_13595 [Acinetobacter baumannii]